MARRTASHDMIVSRKAPKPVGPYVHAVRVNYPGAMLFISGQIPIEVPGGQVFTGPIKKQAEIVMGHLKNIIMDGGFTMDDVVKVNIYLTDLKDFDVVNEVYRQYFVGQSLPARALVQVAALPKGANIEIDAMAIKVGKSPDEMLAELARTDPNQQQMY